MLEILAGTPVVNGEVCLPYPVVAVLGTIFVACVGIAGKAFGAIWKSREILVARSEERLDEYVRHERERASRNDRERP